MRNLSLFFTSFTSRITRAGWEEPYQSKAEPLSLDDTAASDEETTELKTENSMSSEPTKTAELSQVETEVQPGTEQGVVVAQAPTPQG